MVVGSRLTSQLAQGSGRIVSSRTTLVGAGLVRCRISRPIYGALLRYYADKSFPPFRVVKMPSLSPTMEHGNLGTYQKKVGDAITAGDVLVEIETDKAQMDFEMQEEGVLAKILKEQGSKDVPVGNPIAIMIDEGEDVSAFEAFTIDDAGGEVAGGAAKEEKPQKADESKESKEEKPKPSEDKESAIITQESDSTGSRLETSLDRAPGISPAAKKLALEKGVSISSIKGTGRGGAITKEDVEKAAGSGGAAPAAGGAAGPAFEEIPASSMRKTIAGRLTQSMQQNPHYYVSSSVSVTKLLKLRQALNASSGGAYKLSVNDFLVKAIALAALKVPAANSAWIDKGSGNVVIRENHTVDVSVAVATPTGLMTPIVKSAHSIGLQAISSSVKDLGKRARDGKLKPEEYQGGTITISNMGMNDAVERFTAVINPPQACIVAVGTVKKVAVPDLVEDGEEGEAGIKWDDQIVLSGSFDHKVVDGAVGGEFMREVKKIIEDPLKMLL